MPASARASKWYRYTEGRSTFTFVSAGTRKPVHSLSEFPLLNSSDFMTVDTQNGLQRYLKTRILSFDLILDRRDGFEIIGDRQRILALHVLESRLDDLVHKALHIVEIRFCPG